MGRAFARSVCAPLFAVVLTTGLLTAIPFGSDPAGAALPPLRSKTVEFFGGQHTGATAANQNVKNDLATQTFSLAESGVTIQDAYVEIFGQIGANTATTYASSYVYFDACVPSCSPSTAQFAATGSLGANTGDAQLIRLRASVTAEAQMAAYTGGGATRSFAIGYCFATGATCSGTTSPQIFAVTAKLVVTYSYSSASTNETNSVRYPLESAAGVASKTAPQASCTMGSGCPSLSYNADIPELSSQLSQYFQINSMIDQNSTTDVDMTARVGTNTTSPAIHSEAALGNTGGHNEFKYSGLAGYANNTAQTLEVATSSGTVRTLGGENVVTYTAPTNAATRTKTVSYPIGEVITTINNTTKSSLTGPTVYMPEAGVSVKKAWIRINTSADDAAGTMMISTKVGSRSETGQTSYEVFNDTSESGNDSYFNHLIPSADYAEIASATGSSGIAVQMTAQWGATKPAGAVSAELMITYQYTGDSSSYQQTAQYFAGQTSGAPATSLSTATGAINPSFPEVGGVLAVRGSHMNMSAHVKNGSGSESIGSNVTTSTCTATATAAADVPPFVLQLGGWKTVTTTAVEAQTFTACSATSEASTQSNVLTITHQWTTQTPTMTQSQYRWYGNADATTLGSALAAQNTAGAIGSSSSVSRLRMNVGASTVNMSSLSQRFKLQYGSNTGGPWTDVADPWWNPSWATRKKITIDNSESTTDLVDFPLRVSLSASNIDYTKTRDAGQDIRFVDGDGAPLKHEIETWDEAGTSEVWVKVPKIDASSTVDYIYMYYDNAAASDGQDKTNVWDGNSAGVWHLKENPAPKSSPNGCDGATKELCDSTANQNNGDTQGSMVGGNSVTGQVGKGINFDGTDDMAQIADSNSLDATGNLTLSAWIKPDSVGSAYQQIFCKGSDSAGSAYCLGLNTNKVNLSRYTGSWGDRYGGTVVAGTWSHVAITYDTVGNQVQVFLNGVRVLNVAETGNLAADTDPAYIGGYPGVWEYFDGIIDEVRVSKVVRSSDWLVAERKSGLNTLASFGTAETNNAVWRYYNNPTPVSGATLSGMVLSSSTVNASYVENNPTALNPNTVPSGGFGEWDFALDPAGATNGTYYFRMTLADGTALDAYSTYPRLDLTTNQAPNPPSALAQTKTNSVPIPGTNLFDFDANTQGWTSGASTTPAHSASIKRGGTGSLEITFNGTASTTTGDNSPARDLSGGGPVFSAWVYQPSSNNGSSWIAALQSLDGAYNFTSGSYVTLQPDTWTLITYIPPPQSPLMISQIFVNVMGIGASGTNKIYVDDIQQGSGIWTNETSVRFAATVSDLDGSDTDQLCIEAKPIGVAFTNTEDSCATGVAYSGTPVTTSHTLSSLTNGTQYHWQARTKDAAGLYSSWVAYGGNKDSVTASPDFGIDTTAASAGSVKDGPSQGVDAGLNSGALDTLAGNWTGFADAASGIVRYEYSIGTSPGGTTVSGGWIAVDASTTEVTRTGLTLQTSVPYYFNVRAVDALGQTSSVASSNGQVVAPTLNVSVSSSSVIFDRLSSNNSFSSAPKGIDVTASTNAYSGYVVRQYTDGLLSNGSATLPAIAGTYASPASWSGPGFGYTSNDTSIQGSGNKFGNATQYAALTTSPPGDIVADHTANVTGLPISNETHTLTYRVAATPTQNAGAYQGIIHIGVTAIY